MTNPGTGRVSNAHWRELYETAILESDLTKLLGRVEDAKHAIRSRMGELALSDQNGDWEKLADALNVLEDLLKMNTAQRPENDGQH